MSSKEVKRSWDWFWEYKNNSARLNWIDQMEKDEGFIFGDQWSEDEKDELKNRGAPDIVYNVLGRVANWLVALLTANKIKARAAPITTSDNALTDSLNTYDSLVWHKSSGDIAFDQVIEDCVFRSCGYLLHYFDPTLNDYRGDVRYRRIDPREVYVDPAAREWDYSDAEAIIIAKLISIKRAKLLYPDLASKIDKLGGKYAESTSRILTTSQDQVGDDISERWTPEQFRVGDTGDLSTTGQVERIWHLIRYSKERTPVWQFVDPLSGGVVQSSEDPTPYFSEMGLPVPEIVKIYKWQVRRIESIQDDILLEDEILDLAEPDYPIKPFAYAWTGNPYPVSLVTSQEGKQRFLNKCLSITITNAQLASNPKLLVAFGTLAGPTGPTSLDDWRNNWAAPGSINFYQAQEGLPSPKEIYPQQLNQAFFTLAKDIAFEIEQEVGIFSIMQGDPSQAPNTFRATLSIQENGATRHKRLTRRMEMAFERLMRVALQQTLAYVSYLDAGRVVQDESGKEIPFDQSVWSLEHWNHNVATTAGSSLPTNRIAQLQLHMELLDRGVVRPKDVRKYLDIPNVQQIDEEMDELASTQQQLLQTTETNKALSQEVTRLSHALQEADRRVLEVQYEAKLQETLTKTEARMEIGVSRLNQTAKE
jgi:hypothetical protein